MFSKLIFLKIVCGVTLLQDLSDIPIASRIFIENGSSIIIDQPCDYLFSIQKILKFFITPLYMD